MQDYIRLLSGTKFRYHKPRRRDIHIEDIAHNLAHLCRFTGATKRFYSVAEHSCYAADMAPDGFKLAALLHDGHEAICGDVNSILKRLLPDYERIEMKVEKLVLSRFGLPFPKDPRVKEVDMRMLSTEMIQLLYPADAKNIPFKPYDIKLHGWLPAKARREFLKRFSRLNA